MGNDLKNKFETTTIALDSVGCKLNQAEIESLTGQFAQAGYRIVPTAEVADVYILNTCTVTHVADRKSRQKIRMAQRQNPDVRIVVTGCYAERSLGKLTDIPEVSFVIGNGQKMNSLNILVEKGYLSRPSGHNSLNNINHMRRTRAFIKVQDGCHHYCAYCIVPSVRATISSVPLGHVIEEVRQRVAVGYREVVLTGTEIGLYHFDGVDLGSLLEHILEETDISRLRLSSLQPGRISSYLVGLWRDKRLCPHFHLSLQSGSDSVLKRMKRRYTATEFRQAVALIREILPEAAITTDVIVGFPGETEAEFQESYDLCRQMKFARIHVFPYSTRPGTEAATLRKKIDESIKKQRSRKMLALSKNSLHNYSRLFLERTMPVLWEKQSDDGVWSGFTGNYIKVYAKSREDLTNKPTPVKLCKNRGDGLWGELI